MESVTGIIKLVIELLLALATTFLIPWIKERTDANKRSKLLTYVDIAVGAAEQLAKSENWDGEKKKEWVVAYLEKLGFAIDYDEVDAMIEAAVLTLHKELE